MLLHLKLRTAIPAINTCSKLTQTSNVARVESGGVLAKFYSNRQSSSDLARSSSFSIHSHVTPRTSPAAVNILIITYPNQQFTQNHTPLHKPSPRAIPLPLLTHLLITGKGVAQAGSWPRSHAIRIPVRPARHQAQHARKRCPTKPCVPHCDQWFCPQPAATRNLVDA